MADTHSYKVDGEVGRFEMRTHSIRHEEQVLYDTACDLFPRCRYWEWYKTTGFKEIAFVYGATENSYKKTEQLLNRIRHQRPAEGTPSRTLREGGEKEGRMILECLERTTTAVLQDADFTDEGRPVRDLPEYHSVAVTLSADAVRDAIAACDVTPDDRREVEKNPVLYEDAARSVNVSIDDVIVKKQKEERTRPPEGAGNGVSTGTSAPGNTGRVGGFQQDVRQEVKKESRKYIHHTVAHIHQGDRSYTVSGYGVIAVLRVILGYLLKNDLVGNRLQFFVDGQKTLQAAILKAFSWFSNIGLILDWYHLEEKCKRQLSLAMKGRQVRNTVLEKLMRYLWYGMVDRAVDYIEHLDRGLIKNQKDLEVLLNYMERNRPYLPCYEVRRRLGFRNSSNIGEKMNDLLVSSRQKKNGMSWSPGASVSLAALEAIKRNNEYQIWFEYGKLEWN